MKPNRRVGVVPDLSGCASQALSEARLLSGILLLLRFLGSYYIIMKPKKYMAGGQNYGPLFGSPKYWVPYYTKDAKRDHNFGNQPSASSPGGELNSLGRHRGRVHRTLLWGEASAGTLNY